MDSRVLRGRVAAAGARASNPRGCAGPRRSARLTIRAMAPFRNPFKGDKKEKGPSGVKTLLEKVARGREVAREKGFPSVLADVRDGISQRNYGNGGSWPEAAEARRRMECPRCGASTAEATAAAQASGVKVDAMGDPVVQAAAGQHPLGWCKECAEANRLVDVSGGF